MGYSYCMEPPRNGSISRDFSMVMIMQEPIHNLEKRGVELERRIKTLGKISKLNQ